ncbi:hypothetical protein [Microbacterium invictum]|uniref:Antitoxin VbhA domain-containing protein n=1 Tax=Microbacterium invictum TaxID=515415 RepID=A0ABZ0VCE9_9MICO|nr:hypothetical protein [Microbacterium invictum]WQB70336.1 hypothetical protein T9R20_16820 [Microbacterium invictum]
MAPVREITHDALVARREAILDRLNLSRTEFEARIVAAALTPEEWDAKDELEGIEFLLGND